jgi:hypothetical protein
MNGCWSASSATTTRWAARQMLAIVADASRAQELSRITSPTLVLHGKADPLVPFACGADTAKRIAGAKLVGIEGMGHDLPPGVVEHLLAHLLPFLATHTSANAVNTPHQSQLGQGVGLCGSLRPVAAVPDRLARADQRAGIGH